MPKKSRQKFKYLENGKSFQDEIKAFLIIFQGLSLKQIKKGFFGRWESDFKLDKSFGSCNTLNDILNKVCVPNETEDFKYTCF